MDDNRVFVDTNVLLAATDQDRDQHLDALTFLDHGLDGTFRLFLSGQVFGEYLVVATRPLTVNGLGLSTEKAVENVAHFRKALQVLPEDDACSTRLNAMVQTYELKGKRIHDAALLVCMSRHGLRRLKTYNPFDFQFLPDVELMT
jgi:predicted nucleic acid-binding protein